MGKKGGWLSAVKKIFSCQSSHNKQKKNRKTDKWSEKQATVDLDTSNTQNTTEQVKLAEAENEQNRHAYSVALATAAAAEAAVAAAHAAAEVVRLTSTPRNMGRTREELAAVKIQTAFRGYLARRALRALRGLVRLKSLVGGQSVQKQAATTLRHMQTLGRLQYEVRARRIRMSEDNSATQRQILQKREKEIEKLRLSIGEDWDDSKQSKEQIEANLQIRQEAAVRRERSLAYAYSHQQTWRNTPNSGNQTFMDQNIPRWGWSWLERWMASRPWENGVPIIPTDKSEPNGIINSPTPKKQSRPPSRQSPSTPRSKSTNRITPHSPRGTLTTNGRDEDSRSINSVQSDRCRRHSIAGSCSSVRDDESLASSPAVVQGYMGSTESARARARAPSPLGGEKMGTPVKKRLSFSGSPAGMARRHSGPPKVDFSPVKDIGGNS
ncbi:hypothetical protein ABFS83_06G195600 [Erythranthe nasuta]